MSANYTPQNWADNDPTKPVSAGRLTHIELGIATVDNAAQQAVADLQSSVAPALKMDAGEVA